MNDSRAQLITNFKNQHLFSREYSPLYASLFAALARWLDQSPHDPLCAWLLETGHGRPPLEVSILLAAGLHRDILLHNPQLSALAGYYPSVGGTLSAGFPQENDWVVNQEYEQALYHSILNHRDQLRAFIQSSQVQTNETGRGISWLLPLSLAGWPRIHLLDLGASAGLNLVAEMRNYQLFEIQRQCLNLQLGEGRPPQFEVRSTIGSESLPAVARKTPQILSRLGCDLTPFLLRAPIDETTLSSFIWADQTARMERLREGIAAYHRVEDSPAPVELHALDLPAQLPAFLEHYAGDDGEAIICYNTYIRLYLPQKGFALRGILAEWASKQTRPVVWIQWEPPSSLNIQHGKAPQYGWLAWTIDMWFRGQEHHWHVAWVHPHGQQVHWLPGLQNWMNKASALRL